MTAECVTDFMDLEKHVMRRAGERFEVTPERFKAINGTKYGELVREVRPRRKTKTEE